MRPGARTTEASAATGLTRRTAIALTAVAALPWAAGAAAQARPDPLPSWNEGPNKKAILDFVERVKRERVPVPERISTFDNDGTLWVSHPIYTQLAFALDRAREMAAKDPALAARQPFADLLAGKTPPLDEKSVMEVIAATHSGITTDEFQKVVRAWFATARHPRFKRLYTELIYQPQLELLRYLRAEGFKTYICSGGGVDFMRAYAEAAYGIPPEQVIGSSAKTRFEMRDGRPVLLKLPEIGSINDKAGKPENIELHIGRQPMLAFGNSDGDLEMLQYAAGNPRPNLSLILHHDDAEREYAYDRDTKVGTLDNAWDVAVERGWPVVSMKNDWKTVFPPPA